MIITSGNYFRKTYTLTEDTVVTGGNFVLCHVDNVGQLTVRGDDLGDRGGAYSLDIQGGNTRGG